MSCSNLKSFAPKGCIESFKSNPDIKNDVWQRIRMEKECYAFHKIKQQIVMDKLKSHALRRL